MFTVITSVCILSSWLSNAIHVAPENAVLASSVVMFDSVANVLIPIKLNYLCLLREMEEKSTITIREICLNLFVLLESTHV